MADYLALRESRRNFGPSHLTDSSDFDDDGVSVDHDPSNLLLDQSATPQRDPEASRHGHPKSAKGKGRLVDVDLASTIRESAEGFDDEADSRPAPVAQLLKGHDRLHDDVEMQASRQRPDSPDLESAPQTVVLTAPQAPRHDPFWARLYQIALFAMFATFVLVWFHTSAPSKKKPLGDTIYSALTGSVNLLLWDTVITVVVALVWLALLQHHVRVLVFVLVVAVPVILVSFSIYPFVSSFKGAWHGSSIQDKAMRWLAGVPAIMAGAWIVSVYSARHSLSKAVSILEFACRIVAQSPALVLLGFATLGVIVSFTWVWLLMFTRVFLGGHMSKVKTFIIDVNSWWLGAFFILVYLWSLGVIAGIQRATTAATVSQWYFHRLSVPAPASNTVVKASLVHSTTTMLGTISLSTFLSLLIRLPLIILPRRLASCITLAAYSLIPTSLVTLTNPLCLSYAAIHSQPLGISARGLSQLHFVSKSTPTTSLPPGSFSPKSGSTLIPYRLAKLILHATRFVMSFSLGFGGWVSVAHSSAGPVGTDDPKGLKGSLYGYLVGLMAATIGWAILGAVEGVVGNVVDAAVVCWASETGGVGGGEAARYCREAGELFGDDDE